MVNIPWQVRLVFDTALIITPFYLINRYHSLLYEPFRYS